MKALQNPINYQVVAREDVSGDGLLGDAHDALAGQQAGELEAQLAADVAVAHHVAVQLAVCQHHVLEVQRACAQQSQATPSASP